MLFSFLALALVPDVVIRSRDPLPALPWVQSVRASCGSSALTVSGYGAATPLDREPKLLVGERPITGKATEQLLDDLSHRGAAYRLQILCGSPGAITLRINKGERQLDGSIRYRSGAARIRGNLLVSYTGLEEAGPDSFWFR